MHKYKQLQQHKYTFITIIHIEFKYTCLPLMMMMHIFLWCNQLFSSLDIKYEV